MSLNPLNELKRRLEEETTPLEKRLCLAKNIVLSHHLPTAPKERIVAEWLDHLSRRNQLDGTELQKILEWLNCDELTGELKMNLIQVVALFVQKNILEISDMQFIIKFLENDKISSQMSQQIDDYLSISITLLQRLTGDDNLQLSQKILTNLIKYYKDSTKKLEFITKFIVGENLETVFIYLDSGNQNVVKDVCQNVLFHVNKKSFFINYLQTLIRKDSLNDLIAEKGDNIQAVLKIMSIFFEFPKDRSDDNTKFLQDFIAVFVSSYKNEGQMIFAFYIMVANVLSLKQDYITSTMDMTPIEINEKVKRNIFLSMLEIVLQNEVDLSVKLTDTFGAKTSKVEIKKNFLSFLQSIMMGQLKLEGKLDKTTLQIVKTALKLDPSLVEQNLELILPPIMSAKKNPSLMESYKEMLNLLLEILFKLSHGSTFITEILPSLKNYLVSLDTEQIEISSDVKSKSKLITGNDVFPVECVELYGMLTSDLMFRQNKELLETLQKDLLMYCISLMDADTISPSTIILTEVLSALFTSYLHHNKMADHIVPAHVAEEFWSSYSGFECAGLRKFGLAVLKFRGNTPLLVSFLNVCQSYAKLKLLNINYSYYKLEVTCSSPLFDLSGIMKSLDSQEWVTLLSTVEDSNALVVMDILILLKTIAMEVLAVRNPKQSSTEGLHDTKTYLINRLSSNPAILDPNICNPLFVFVNLDQNQFKKLAKILMKLYINDDEAEIFNSDAIKNNRLLLNALLLEVARIIAECLQNCDEFTKALSEEVTMAAFAKEVDIKKFFNGIGIEENSKERIQQCVELMKMLQIGYLEENYQLTAVFLLLVIKKCCQLKKIRKNIDGLLQNIFELSTHPPDLYKVFPVDFIFCFKDTMLLDLLTLKIKTSNQQLLIKNLIESAVKRVKVETDLVKSIVELLLKKSTKNANTIDAFGDPTFQMICLIVPLLVKQRKVITVSASRSILADLQEKLHKPLLDTFKNVDFSQAGNIASGKNASAAGNTEDSFEDNMAILNAMAAYSLTISKYCESNDVEDRKNLDCLLSGLEFFVDSALQTLRNPFSKPQHIESSIQLIIITLRHIKKLETNNIFNERDKLFTNIWLCINSRLLQVFSSGGCIEMCPYLDDMGTVLKFVFELVSVDCFVNKIVGDLANLVALKSPLAMIRDDSKTDLICHLVAQYLWVQCLKANTTGPRCNALTRLMHQTCDNLRTWIRQHYDSASVARKRKLDVHDGLNIVRVDNVVCDVIKVDLDTLTEAIFAGKRITLDYKFMDSIFELQHLVHMILGFNTPHIKCDISWHAFFTLYLSAVGILNSLLVCREEIIEDRWPCLMQCYRALISTLCSKASTHSPLESYIEDKLAECAHSIEKLTQSVSKRKKHVTQIAAYTIADICSQLEEHAPTTMVRQHMQNSVRMLIEASDSTHGMAFLKRALAGSIGQTTVTNLYNMYKRYHKYTGNS